ncbi:MAG: sugar phosphate isomerase/epimerase [Lentisphaeria bacterium]|nr:sugar phosphate isomerase/epimerase [Lentisphaeria bacterium]
MLAENVRVSHFYVWSRMPKKMIPELMSEFAWNGIGYFALTGPDCKEMLKDPDFSTLLPWYASQCGLSFADVHAPYGMNFDLDLLEPLRRKEMIQEHTYLLERLGNYGVRTYTLHVGAVPWCATPPAVGMEELRKNALDSLEKLLPVAEKSGIVLCVENAFEPVDSADEVLFYIRHFNHPNLRCCFDSGHANIMRKTGKDLSKYKKEFKEIVWRGDLRLTDGEFDKMAPYIAACHLHDNDGYSDAHLLPGKGTIDWDLLMENLSTKCPLLEGIQDESGAADGKFCIGRAAAAFRILSGPQQNKNEALRKL